MSSGDLRYNLVIIVNNIVLLEVANGVSLKCSHHKKRSGTYVM